MHIHRSPRLRSWNFVSKKSPRGQDPLDLTVMVSHCSRKCISGRVRGQSIMEKAAFDHARP